MSIYNNFKPTYLYIKQHAITGKLYFGKTVRNPETYKGSGDYWSSHIKKHGKEHVITLWYCLFTTKESIIEFATAYCITHNIGYGDTTIWANEKPENGCDGGLYCYPRSKESRIKQSTTNKSKELEYRTCPHCNITGTKMIMARWHFDNCQLVTSKVRFTKSATCPHCGKVGGVNMMHRWHFSNCKHHIGN